MSDQKEFNVTQKAQVSATVFSTQVIVNGLRTSAIIDSGASGNFASESFIQRTGLATQTKRQGYELIAVDGSPLPCMERETIPLPLAIQQHHEEIVLDVTAMASWDIVLGMPWLRKHNPVVDWKKGVLTFEGCGCATRIKPVQRRKYAADEAKDQLCTTQLAPTPSPETGATPDRHCVGPAGHEITGRGTGNPGKQKAISAPDVPKEYQKWLRLFQEEEGKDALPRHQPWDLSCSE